MEDELEQSASTYMSGIFKITPDEYLGIISILNKLNEKHDNSIQKMSKELNVSGIAAAKAFLFGMMVEKKLIAKKITRLVYAPDEE